MLVHSDHNLVHGELQLAGRALHDADVGLVRNQPVDVGIAQPRLGQRGAQLPQRPGSLPSDDWQAVPNYTEADVEAGARMLASP